MTIRETATHNATTRQRRNTTVGAPATPRYPQAPVLLVGGDRPVGILIGKVAIALRYRVGDQAADAFKAAAHTRTTRQRLLRLIRATIRTR